MLSDALGRLGSWGPLGDYTYIGFGSPYFVDFTLMHKQFGMKQMISIELEEGNEERFEFNRPFSCIEVKFGHSTQVLPTIKVEGRVIAWLDYDDKLKESMLGDIEQIVSRADGGSVVLVTVDADPDSEPEGARLDLLRERVGQSRIPLGTKLGDLDGWGLASVSREIIHRKILEIVNDRNGVLNENDHFQYRQLFNFCYKDSKRMATVGGLLYRLGDSRLVDECKFH